MEDVILYLLLPAFAWIAIIFVAAEIYERLIANRRTHR